MKHVGIHAPSEKTELQRFKSGELDTSDEEGEGRPVKLEASGTLLVVRR